ncbi:helix-turn-helix transcriptional regulator [bacterium]|nr:helix-turn-helix transcriptional regulator [bacterium]
MKIGCRIKELREKTGLSQTELAEKIHTTKQTIYKYETGIVTNIPSDRIEQMSSIFGCSPCYIMGWDDKFASSSSSIDLSDLEKKIIIEYRRADSIDKEMVLRILKIEEKKNGEKMA